MKLYQIILAAVAIAIITAPSLVQAQTIPTRRGAVAGAIIGGIIGDQNNRAFTGAVVGGLVGAAAGRGISQARNGQPLFGNNGGYNQGFGNGSYGGQGFNQQPAFYGGRNVGPNYAQPTNQAFYRGPKQNFSGGGYDGGYRPSCPNSRW